MKKLRQLSWFLFCASPLVWATETVSPLCTAGANAQDGARNVHYFSQEPLKQVAFGAGDQWQPGQPGETSEGIEHFSVYDTSHAVVPDKHGQIAVFMENLKGKKTVRVYALPVNPPQGEGVRLVLVDEIKLEGPARHALASFEKWQKTRATP